MTPLPIDPVLPEIVARLREHRSLVLVAPPGSGKTTRVPPALIRSGLLGPEYPALVLLQPRRVAARAAASRIADENGWAVGEEVGYQIRFERRVGPRTRIRVETEGILNRRLISDPFLEGVGCVILDEFHERSLHTDVAIALLKEVRETVRDDLFLIVMSATLDAGPVSEFLGGAPVVRAEGRTFPVEVRYRPVAKPSAAENVAAVVEDVVQNEPIPGHVLVFLPGAEEIRRVSQRLSPLASAGGLDVLPLHGALSGDDQDRALRPSERTKIILATNIAETSLTIDGVTTVIDAGLARFAGYDAARGWTAWNSGGSAGPRPSSAPAAGRTRPGRCVRLWSEREHRGLDESDAPEVARVDLSATVLSLHAQGREGPPSVPLVRGPPAGHLDAAERLLGLGGSTRPNTPSPRSAGVCWPSPHTRGSRVAPRGRGGPRRATPRRGVAALLSEKDILLAETNPFQGPRSDRPRGPAGRGDSDLFVRLDALNEAERSNFSPGLRARGIDPFGARRVARVRDDLARLARPLPRHTGRDEEPDDEELLRWVLMAYPDRVVRRRGSEATGVMVGGRGVRLEPTSVVRDAEFFLALDPREDRRGGTREARVRHASALRVVWLQELFPDRVRSERSVRYDAERGKAVGVSSLSYEDLLLKEDQNARVEPAEASAVLAETLRDEAPALVRADEAAAAWLARLELLRSAMPEAGLPALDDQALAEVVADACVGRRSRDEVTRTSLIPFLRSRLTHAQARLLDEQAPETLAVPSGSRIRLTYEPGRPPVLAVRLQELFGLAETPRVAAGRVPVLLHLLGPNYRPVQVTDDLRSFWATTYFQVRKDLRARYPRHSWPDDPTSARAEAKGGRRS
ncbi:MAG: ATP-dependent helicase C-terminal domain-containing protein [Isosphaeraceae bacterium]